MAKKTAEVKQKIAEIESLITEKQETLDMQKDLFLDAKQEQLTKLSNCLLYTSPSPRDTR